jgi:hypothetical protein
LTKNPDAKHQADSTGSVGQQVRDFGQAERLGPGLAAHARCLLIACPLSYLGRGSTGSARPGS